MTGIVPYQQFAGVDHPVSLAIQMAGQNWVAGFIDLGAILGITTVILVMTYGMVRLAFAISRDGMFPKVFSEVHPKYQTPFKATWMIGLGSSLVAGFVASHALGKSPEEAFRYAVTTGSASAYSFGLCTKEDIDRLLVDVNVVELIQS